MLKIGDRYLVAYSATGGGLGGSHRGNVLSALMAPVAVVLILPTHKDIRTSESVESRYIDNQT